MSGLSFFNNIFSHPSIYILQFKGIQNKLEIPVLKADKRFFPLKHRGDGADEWGIISDVVVEGGSTIIVLRSVLQVSVIYVSFINLS